MWKYIKWVRTLLKQTDASSAFDSFRDDYGASRALEMFFCFLTYIYLYMFSKKCTEAILSDSTRKLLRFEITNMLIAVSKEKQFYRVIYYDLRRTFVPCKRQCIQRWRRWFSCCCWCCLHPADNGSDDAVQVKSLRMMARGPTAGRRPGCDRVRTCITDSLIMHRFALSLS